MEGFINVAHFSWVHSATLGDPNDVKVPDHTTIETDYGFSATLNIHFLNDAKQVIMNAAPPMTVRSTRLFTPFCQNYDNGCPVEHAYDFNLKIFEEAYLIVKNQKPEFLPLDLSMEAHFPADRSST